MNVLIADDDATTRLWLDCVLREWGHRTAQAADGDEAWRLLQGAAPPALILLDWLMPGRDGIDICRGIKADPRTRDCFVILLTARASADDIAAAIAAGADDLLAKPFEPAQLQLRLRLGARVVELQRALAARASDSR